MFVCLFLNVKQSTDVYIASNNIRLPASFMQSNIVEWVRQGTKSLIVKCLNVFCGKKVVVILVCHICKQSSPVFLFFFLVAELVPNVGHHKMC